MSKLFPPTIDIDIYNDGFEGKDLLNRKETGERLSELIERIEDPMVIALNGGWGTGKSFFLKCWVGEHTREESRTAKTVYFDAFAHDYLDNPLIALTEVLAERVVQEDPTHGLFLKNVKSITPKLVQAGLRIALAAGTSGLSEASGAAAKAVIEATGKELTNSVDNFLKQEDGKKAAMKDFSAALKELTQPKTKDATPQKIVIVIDELDRCRPDYALQMLEIIKHFFSVPHIHFILGANISELENTVKARYGAGVNASLYLEKFINLSMSLPIQAQHRSIGVNEVYFDEMTEKMNFDNQRVSVAREFLEFPTIAQNINLRSVERLLSLLALLPTEKTQGREAFQLLYYGCETVIVTLILMRVIKPDFYALARNHTLTFDVIVEFFGSFSTENRALIRNHEFVLQIWRYVFERNEDTEFVRQNFGVFRIEEQPNDFITLLDTKYIEQFEISGD